MRLECGHEVEIAPGAQVYNYYDCWFGVVQEVPDSAGWFDVQGPTTKSYLNTERVCCIPCGERFERAHPRT